MRRRMGGTVDWHVSQRRDSPVSEPAGDSERARPEGPQPHRDRAGGLGFHLEFTDAVVPPVLGIAGVCPCTADNLDRFGEATDLFGPPHQWSSYRRDVMCAV